MWMVVDRAPVPDLGSHRGRPSRSRTAIAAIEGLIIVWLRIPSFVVTLAGLLGLNGVLLWLFEKTGSVGLGGVIQTTTASSTAWCPTTSAADRRAGSS